MIIHILASYDGSQIGFQPGYFDCKDYGIKDDSENPIAKIIETGYIKQVNGNISKYCNLNSGSFILLYKNLNYSYDNKDFFGKTVYTNLAFIFEENEKDIFKNLYYFFKETDKTEIARLLADSLIPDREDVNFGYRIDSENFRNFFNKASSYKCDSHPDNITESLFVDVNMPGKGGDLREKFNLKSDYQFTFDKESNRYQAGEKQKDLEQYRQIIEGGPNTVPSFSEKVSKKVEKVKEKVKEKEITQKIEKSVLNLVKFMKK